MIELDGAYGEGGGQIVRTALTLAALTGQPTYIRRIRAGRREPGLAPQHLTAVVAMARLCAAQVEGDWLGSTELRFQPTQPVQTGDYTFDVAALSKGGSAGAVTLLLQTLGLPLMMTKGNSHLRLVGGTHVAWSPPYHFMAEVYFPMLAHMGMAAKIQLNRWGFYPVGNGEIEATLPGNQQLSPLTLTKRGDIRQVRGLAVAAELPAHIAQRITNRAVNVLKEAGLPVTITPHRVKSAGPGAGLFLTAEYEDAVAGFSALGALGKPSDVVADEACSALLAHHDSAASVDAHLADQLLLPMALAPGQSQFVTSEITEHLVTNAHVIRQFLPIDIQITGDKGQSGTVSVHSLSSTLFTTTQAHA